jgi:carboxyl-terminal processing protease
VARWSPGRATATVAVVSVFGLLTGSWAGSQAADRARDPYESLDRFARALTTIEGRYVEEVDPNALVEAALKGMARSLDPHTRFLTVEEARALRDDTAGSYEGLGVELRAIPEGARVLDVLAGGPAERDGVLPGDVIVAVNGATIAGLDLEAISDRLQGPRGTEVRLTLTRVGRDAPFDVETVRDRVVAPPTERGRIADVGYVRLRGFSHGAGEAVAADLAALQADGALSGFILDLRDNPGGVLDEAVAVTDLFVANGPIVSTRGRSEGEEVHAATPGGPGEDLRVAVLVNGMSASASEIVAAALQETGRGTLVGTHTYGKGSVQTLFENRDGSALKLTISRYYTPLGNEVAPNRGRDPDVLVRLPPDGEAATAPLRARLDALDVPDDERQELLALLDRIPVAEIADRDVAWHLPIPERAAGDAQIAAALALFAAP